MTEPPWSMTWTTFLTIGVIAIAVIAAAWTALNRPRPRPDLPAHHAAAAAIIALVAWDALTLLPGFLDAYLTATAGIGPEDLGGALLGQQSYLIVATAAIVGSVVAIVGILRRRMWGAVLGIGMSAAYVIGSVAGLVNLAILESESVIAPGGGYLAMVAPELLLGAVPSVVAIGLLVWPLVRRLSGADEPPADRFASPEWDPRSASQPR